MFCLSHIKPVATLTIGAALLLPWVGSSVQGDVIAENFNNYGDTSGSLAGQGQANGGWNGAWTVDKVDYLAGSSGQLSYTAQGYNNNGNQTDANDGGAAYQSDKNIGSKSQRTFATPMTGVIWVSALVKGTNSLLWLGGSNTNNYVGIRDGRVAFRHAGTSAEGSQVNTSTTHLILVKITANADASGNDRITYWLDPDLSGGESGLGPSTPDYTRDDADALNGASLNAIQLSFNEVGDVIDAIRISNDANGFQEVTTPEPGSAAMIGVAACALVLIRRNRRSFGRRCAG